MKVEWIHEFEDDPVLYLSELGEDGYETRKVQFYRDGRSEWASETFETATAGLSEIPFASLDEISRNPEFVAEEITAAEFERAWTEARSGHRRSE